MLFFMYDERFNVAFEKADVVLQKLNLSSNEIVDIEELVDVVANLTETEISVKEFDFDEIDEGCEYGAMMCVTKKGTKQYASILLNSNKKIDAAFKRFSLAHELGHLITNKFNLSEKENSFTISTHINYAFNEIKKEDYDNNEFLLNEEIANIFALKVLIPMKTLVKVMIDTKNDFKKIAKYFGVKENTIKARLDLEL